MAANKFNVGDKVRLPAINEPGNEQPEEIGVVQEVETGGMYIVHVDSTDDDGIREVHEDDMEAMQ